jgi:alanyl-tRNA synthetase
VTIGSVTERLYYTDSYLHEFEATVVERSGDGTRIYLDRTAFYPTSGGQPFDTGELSGVPVIDVVDEDSRIAHVLAGPLQTERVTGRVEWNRRFDHMQQHTGQHLLSAVIAESLGYPTIAVHFGRESSSIDVEATSLSTDQAAELEQAANRIVFANRPIHVSFEEVSEAIGLRKRPARDGIIRIITIQELDRSACGGTHVRATGEIGPILIRRIERVRKAVRLEFLCGSRAISRARADHALLVRLSADLSAAPEELPILLAARQSELKEAQSTRRELERQLDLYRAKELYQAASPDASGIRRVVLREGAGSVESLRGIAQAFATMPMGMFVGTVGDPPSVVLSTSQDSGIDAAGVLKSLLTAVNGRGGGSANLAQGVVPGPGQLEQVLAAIGRTKSLPVGPA